MTFIPPQVPAQLQIDANGNPAVAGSPPNGPSPKILFQVVITPRATEQVGAAGYYNTPAAVNGENYPDDQTIAAANTAVRGNNVVTWLPGIGGAGGIEVYNGQTFWAMGRQAIYLMYTYGIGVTPPAGSGFSEIPYDRQYLKVLSQQ